MLFHLPEFIPAEAMGTELPRRYPACRNCKKCQFRTDSLSFKENTEYKIILSKLKLDVVRKKWVAGYPFNTLVGRLIESEGVYGSSATLTGLPKDTLDELVRTLINTVYRDFQTCTNPENFLARELHTAGTNILTQVILLGASNLGHCADRLRQSGKLVVDLTSPGWIASPDNITMLQGKLEKN
jgi:hypothetical protein